MINIFSQINEVRTFLKQGKIIAYPTEAIYGLGCDPYNQQAVEKLLTLKQRPISKGFIVLIASWDQLFPLIAPVPEDCLKRVRETWPGPVTWVFPKASLISPWLSGEHSGIAIRMSAHPIAHQLCLEGPVVSTSVNISGYPPARTIEEICTQFPTGIDAIVAGDLGGANQPSAIYDVLTGMRLR